LSSAVPFILDEQTHTDSQQNAEFKFFSNL